MTTVVISQPMLFPWVGMFEQLRLADVYVHYDDVAFSKGSFTNRVQLKTGGGPCWMTIPLADRHHGQTIRALRTDETQPWRERHLRLLEQHYRDAPHAADMLSLVERVYAARDSSVCEIVMRSMEEVATYYALRPDRRRLVASRHLEVPDKGTTRVLGIVRALGGTRYVTGHGARNYLNHAAFEAEGIQVAYLDYQRVPYPQLHGAFTPYVSTLDLIANVGPAGRNQFVSPAVDWKEFLGHV